MFSFSSLFVFVAVVIIRLIILCCRESEIESGHKVRCGVYTLLFVSVIGGILTLCIPEENKQYRSSGEMPPLERLSIITKYENELSNGEISMEEYKRKMAQLDGEPDEQYDPKKLTEEEKIRIIRQYKELLDENLITEEEYNKKKQEIL